MQKTTLGWLAWELTHSPAWVGTLALTELFAAVVVTPFAGAMTDRTNAFRLILATQAAMLAVPLALVASLLAGTLTIWALLIFALVDSVTQAFNQPVRMSIIGALAGRDRLPQAVASNSIAFNLARALGPAIAGMILLKTGEAAAVFTAVIPAYAAMLLVLAVLRRKLNRAAPPPSGTNLFGEITDGCRYVLATPSLLVVFLMAVTFSLLGRPFTELFPAIAGQTVQGGPDVLSALMSAQGVGALVGGLIMLKPRTLPALALVTLVGGLTMCASLMVFSVAGGVTLALALMTVAGLGHVICNIGMQSLVQSSAGSRMRGRVIALYGLIFRGGPALSAAMIGLAAEWISLQHLIGACAMLCAVFMLGIGAVSRSIFLRPAPAE
jgi:predicted MFS family arabinose efflux permease